jgi:hypothetical protein
MGGAHVAEYTQIIRFGGQDSWALMALVLSLSATWLVGNVVGIAFAYRVRVHSSLRCAATGAALGVAAMILTNTGFPLWTVPKVWTILIWLPFVTTIVVFASSAFWLHERRLHPGPAATGQE